MSRKFDIVIVVITQARILTKVIDSKAGYLEEEHQRTPAGNLDCLRGNFEDEPELPDGLLEALLGIQEPALAVMEGLVPTEAPTEKETT